MTMLEIRDLRVVIAGKPVLDGLSLFVAEREVVGLIGAPGCGKSTLLKSVFGLVPVAAGEIRYGGRDVANRCAREQILSGIVLVAQGGQVFRGLPVEENLYLAGYTLDPKHTAERIEVIYDFFPRLKERRAQAAGLLSGGERQMLALGMGLIPEPSLLLLDEPSTGLSPLLTERILAEVKALTKKLGCTVVVVEQNVKNALLVSDRVVVLQRGRIGYEHTVDAGTDSKPLLEAYAFS
ncbi:MAG: ABC transporter ATP-binding protein [Bradyrhizobiaceae bacterium]|nr:ABC transporter ATP-binding protein [Bradyrhizobiaceae bacterium]